MAPKRPSPLEDPPSVSSSSSTDDIDDREDGEEEQEQNAESEEEEYESENEEEDERENKKHSVRKPTQMTTPQPQSSESEGSDPEIHSDEVQPSPTASDFTIKPILSKPVDDSTKPKKNPSKPAAPASKSAGKRPADIGKKGTEPQKKKSKVSNGDEEDGAVEEKKSAVHRLWSEDDEIAILKGMIEYQKKWGDSHADMGLFHDFMKKSLHVDVSKNQLLDKVRRLKKKYLNNAGKAEDPVFSKPHEHRSFELSKKIWGRGAGNSVDENAKAKGNSSKAKKTARPNNSAPSPTENNSAPLLKENNPAPLPKEDRPELLSADGLKAEGKDLKIDPEDFWSIYPRLQESLEVEKSAYLSMSELGKSLVKERMSMIGSTKAKELEEKWKNLCMDEIALYLKRVELIQEQTKLVLDAMKASKS